MVDLKPLTHARTSLTSDTLFQRNPPSGAHRFSERGEVRRWEELKATPAGLPRLRGDPSAKPPIRREERRNQIQIELLLLVLLLLLLLLLLAVLSLPRR